MTDPAVLKRFAAEWGALFPSCSEVNHTEVAELSANNLAFADPQFVKDWPAISVAKQELWSPSDFALKSFDFPPALHYSYGPSSGNVRFLVSLREPIARRNSLLYQWFYHHVKPGLARGPFDPGARLCSDLENLVTKNQFSYAIWHGLYGRHLQEWFFYWPASQFLFYPFKYMTSQNQVICKSISQHVRRPLNCVHLLERRNDAHPHPAVEELVPAALLRKANKALAGELQRLLDVLVQAHGHGLRMPAFEPDGPATSDAVEAWLVNGW